MPRPAFRFRKFIGHKKQVNLLKRQLDGALARQEPFPHTLFMGPSGVGKTLLVEALAEEYGTNLAKLTGYASAMDLAEQFVNRNVGDFVFIDEAHNLKPKSQELLYRVIDNCKVPMPKPKSSDDDSDEDSVEEVDAASCTIILATDQPGHLLNALDKRMPIRITLSFYPIAELKEIVDQLASDLNLLISPQVANVIAQVSGGLPRRAKHHLQNLRLFFLDSERYQLGLPQVREFLRAFEMDSNGLGPDERRYLKFLHSQKSASLESLALFLGTDTAFVRRQIEPLLNRHGLIAIGQKGRQLTPKGFEKVASQVRKRPTTR